MNGRREQHLGGEERLEDSPADVGRHAGTVPLTDSMALFLVGTVLRAPELETALVCTTTRSWRLPAE